MEKTLVAAAWLMALFLAGCATGAKRETASRVQPHAGATPRVGYSEVESGGTLTPSDLRSERLTPAEMLDQRQRESRTLPAEASARAPIFYGTVPSPNQQPWR